VSPAFADGAVRSLVAGLRSEGIAATVGARYPARHRENLVQLFTPRYLADDRPVVRALAALGRRVDAVQLELGIALRWPGPWRARLRAACRAAGAALAAAPVSSPEGSESPRPGGEPAVARRLEFTSPGLSGLAALDAGRGGRLLLFPAGGGLALFTGERTHPEPEGHVGALALLRATSGRTTVSFRGPMLRFPDTSPFLDLERGLAAAALLDAEVELALEPHHAAGHPGEFGMVAGEVRIDGHHLEIAGRGFVEDGTPPTPWPRVRAALHVGPDAGLSLTVGLDGGEVMGFLCERGRHVPVADARALVAASHPGSEDLVLEVRLADGRGLRLAARPIHRLPVVRAHEPMPLRLDYLACALDAGQEPAGWCELAGV
jgi:hypothetical protein